MKLYMKFFAMNFKSKMQYKVSFIFLVIGRFIVTFGMILTIFFMFQRYNTVGGFTFEEILLCSSVINMSFAIAECFARGFDIFDRMVRNSEFDRIMVRPRNEIFQILAGQIEFARLGGLLQGIAILIYVVQSGNIIWTFDKIFTLIIMVISGTVVFSSLFLIYAAICFFTLEGLEFMNVFLYGGRDFGHYPYVIYGNYILKFFTFIVPLALFQYYPLLYVLGRTTNKFYMFTPFFGILFIIPAYMLWRFGVSKYKSNGS